MTRKLYSALVIAHLTFWTAAARADSDHHAAGEGNETNAHDEHEQVAHDHVLELATSAGLVYLAGEREFAFGLHLHGLVAVGQSPWSLGLGYERIFDEHAHNTVGPVVQYRLTHHWSVNLSPGVSFSDEHPDEFEPAAHVETAYEVEFGRLHLGPSLEAAFDPHDMHFTLGAHVGIGL